MKQKVVLSIYSWVITLLALVVLIVLLCVEIYQVQELGAIIAAAALMVLICSALLYAPLSIEANDSELRINKSFTIKTMPMQDIKSVVLCPPTMAEMRLCGSGGFCGYWGWFWEKPIGKYFAYYGKASDCFLVTLKNGRRYMLGCKNPFEMVKYISERISQ